MPTHTKATHTHTHSPALPSTASGWSDFRQVLLFGVNLCLLLDCLPQEEQGQCLVLTVIEWPIYILLIDSKGFWWGFFFFFFRVAPCKCVRQREKRNVEQDADQQIGDFANNMIGGLIWFVRGGTTMMHSCFLHNTVRGAPSLYQSWTVQ